MISQVQEKKNKGKIPDERGRECGRDMLSDNETKRKVVYVQITSLRGYPQGLGRATPLGDSDDAQGRKDREPSRTFSAFATPSGTNLHNTVADSNHRLASLNWVALQDGTG